MGIIGITVYETRRLHDIKCYGRSAVSSKSDEDIKTVSFTILRSQFINVLESKDLKKIVIRFSRNTRVLLIMNFNCYIQFALAVYEFAINTENGMDNDKQFLIVNSQ